MLVKELGAVLYGETKIELEYDHHCYFTGIASMLSDCIFSERTVREVYIGVDGETLIISIGGIRKHKT